MSFMAYIRSGISMPDRGGGSRGPGETGGGVLSQALERGKIHGADADLHPPDPVFSRGKRGWENGEGMRKLWRNDVFWNAAGSLLYALASMVLSFFVLRLMGPRDGGIFGFGFSTFGQQIFIIAYFGIRPFQITDMAGEYRFSEYHFARRLSSFFALLSSLLFLWLMVSIGSYDGIKAELLFLLSFYKLLDGFSDVYESELQRRGRLYLAGQSLFSGRGFPC